MNYTFMESPVGPLMIAGDEQGLKFVSFSTGKKPVTPAADWGKNTTYISDAIDQLDDYFTGKRTTFDLKLTPFGTQFQLKVLRALQTIPYGVTTSYGHIAKEIGHPKASRAVGAANGRNPISIIIPCHRVIGHSGNLVGFGGGLSTKEALLSLEQKFGVSNLRKSA